MGNGDEVWDLSAGAVSVGKRFDDGGKISAAVGEYVLYPVGLQRLEIGLGDGLTAGWL